jgi:hypothetical protein
VKLYVHAWHSEPDFELSASCEVNNIASFSLVIYTLIFCPVIQLGVLHAHLGVGYCPPWYTQFLFLKVEMSTLVVSSTLILQKELKDW